MRSKCQWSSFSAAAEIKLNALMKRDCLSLKRPRETKAWSHARNGFDPDVFPSRGGGGRTQERRCSGRLAPTSHFSSRGGAAPTKLAEYRRFYPPLHLYSRAEASRRYRHSWRRRGFLDGTPGGDSSSTKIQ